MDDAYKAYVDLHYALEKYEQESSIPNEIINRWMPKNATIN